MATDKDNFVDDKELDEIKDECEYFRCQKCGTIIIINQKEMNEQYHTLDPRKIWYPEECLEYQGGCGRKSIFYRIKKEWLKRHSKENYSQYLRDLIEKDTMKHLEKKEGDDSHG